MYKIRYTMPHGERLTETTYETANDAKEFLLSVGFVYKGGVFTDGETIANIRECL